MITASEDLKKKELNEYMESVRDKEHPESYLIAILHKAQELFGYLSTGVMDDISVFMRIPTAHIWGVATFYHYFNLEPCGKHMVSVCMGTACYVKGAGDLLETLKEELGVDVGGTTDDMVFTLQEARCLGACGLAPVMMIDDKIYGKLTPEKTIEIIRGYRTGAAG